MLKEQARDRGLPQLEGLMSLQSLAAHPDFTGEVQHNGVVRVDPYCLVPNNQLLEQSSFEIASTDLHVRVSNLKLMPPHGDIVHLGGIMDIELDDKEAHNAMTLVDEEIEIIIFIIIHDLLDVSNLVQFIEINEFLSVEVQVDTILFSGDDEDGLILVHDELLRLRGQWLLIFENSPYDLCLEVELEYLVRLGEDDRVWILARLSLLEEVLHGHLFEDGQIFDDDSLVENKLVVLYQRFCGFLLVDEQLVLLLLAHDEVLTADDGDILLAGRLTKTDDLVGLARLRLQEGDWDFSTGGEVCVVHHDHLVDTRH